MTDAFGEPLPGSDRYEYEEEIGHGRYAEVYRATEKSCGGRKTAVKYMDLNGYGERPIYAKREIEALHMLEGHPHVIQLYDVCENKFGVSLILEYCTNDLTTVLKNTEDSSSIPQRQERFWWRDFMYQLLRALHHCHSHDIMHRDVCPNNVLLNESGCVKLGDFGISRRCKSPHAHREQAVVAVGSYTPGMGTRWYMAPELLFGATQYGCAIDMWSAGCILAEMIQGKPLFPGSSDIDQICRIIDVLGSPEKSWKGITKLPDWGKIDFPQMEPKPLGAIFQYTDACPPEAVDLLSGMLRYDPEARITAGQALEHPFFKVYTP